MSEPISTVTFEVKINNHPRTIRLGPELMCTKTIKDALALRMSRIMDEWSELMSMKGDLPEEVFGAEGTRISQDRLYLKRNQSMDLAIEMFVDVDCMPIVILNGCEDVQTIEEATEIANACPNVVTFVQQIVEFANEVMESVKNSNSPPNQTA